MVRLSWRDRDMRGIDKPYLTFDTSGPYIAAALSDQDTVLDSVTLDMARGQAEALMPHLQTLLKRSGLAWGDIAVIGVGIGPGNFTGIRIAVSAARGLALGLGIPAIGLSAFALRRDPYGPGANRGELVTLNAPRGLLYGQCLRHGVPEGAALTFSPDDPPAHLRQINRLVTGDHAETVARHLSADANPAPAPDLADLPRRMAMLTDWLVMQRSDHARPAPLYVRGADAAPPRDPAPVILP